MTKKGARSDLFVFKICRFCGFFFCDLFSLPINQRGIEVFWFLRGIKSHHDQEKLAKKTALPAFSHPFCIDFTDARGAGERSA
ncbi:MAG: hypothetical protein K6C40_15705 [Thermoguttaceae bacterium]|nr:hypothetical protein [Thermoguttaceae bacterium]